MNESICFIKCDQVKRLVSRPKVSMELVAPKENVRRSEGLRSAESLQNDAIKMRNLLCEMEQLRSEIKQFLETSSL